MSFFNGKVNCHKCGMEISKKTAEKRFGKFFCSKEEAEEYSKEEKEQKLKQKSSGGCC